MGRSGAWRRWALGARLVAVAAGIGLILATAYHDPDTANTVSDIIGTLVSLLAAAASEYTTATEQAKALGKAAEIELEDLPLTETHRYLRTSSNKTRAKQWDSLFGHLRANPHDPAGHALTTVLKTPLSYSGL